MSGFHKEQLRIFKKDGDAHRGANGELIAGLMLFCIVMNVVFFGVSYFMNPASPQFRTPWMVPAVVLVLLCVILAAFRGFPFGVVVRQAQGLLESNRFCKVKDREVFDIDDIDSISYSSERKIMGVVNIHVDEDGIVQKKTIAYYHFPFCGRAKIFAEELGLLTERDVFAEGTPQ